jgi:hypothetical protein
LSAPEPGHHQPTNPDVRYERRDVTPSALLKAGAWILGATVLVVVALWQVYFFFAARETARQPPPPVMRPGAAVLQPPPPLLQRTPTGDLASYRAQQARLLDAYAWVDRPSGVVRIPVAEAMRLVAEQGLPSFGGSGAPAPSPQGARP